MCELALLEAPDHLFPCESVVNGGRAGQTQDSSRLPSISSLLPLWSCVVSALTLPVLTGKIQRPILAKQDCLGNERHAKCECQPGALPTVGTRYILLSHGLN